MVKSREEAQGLRQLLSITKKKEDDPLMSYLVDFKGRIAQAEKLVTDPDKTAFFFVTLPEALPIAVIRRFISWFTDFGIPVGGVIVNMLIDKSERDTAPDFVRNRIEMQDGYMKEIGEEFEGMVRSVLPLYDDEIRGVSQLRMAAQELFA